MTRIAIVRRGAFRGPSSHSASPKNRGFCARARFYSATVAAAAAREPGKWAAVAAGEIMKKRKTHLNLLKPSLTS